MCECGQRVFVERYPIYDHRTSKYRISIFVLRIFLYENNFPIKTRQIIFLLPCKARRERKGPFIFSAPFRTTCCTHFMRYANFHVPPLTLFFRMFYFISSCCSPTTYAQRPILGRARLFSNCQKWKIAHHLCRRLRYYTQRGSQHSGSHLYAHLYECS